MRDTMWNMDSDQNDQMNGGTPNTNDAPQSDYLKMMAQEFGSRPSPAPEPDTSTETTNLENDIMASFQKGADVEPQAEDDAPINLDAVELTPDDLTSQFAKEDFPYPSVPSKHEDVPPPPDIPPVPLAQEVPEPVVPPVSDQEAVAQLEQNISEGFQSAPLEETPTQEGPTPTDESRRGIGNTYYSDLSRAMSSNEPETMSELLQRARFEEKEKKILSPRSKKNIFYIVTTVILLIVTVLAWFFLFQKDDPVSFITEQRVSGLVYSDEDLGINLTGLQTFQTKAAIRKVLERKHPSNSLSQIYYVKEDDFGNLRRLGVKNVFDATDNQTPELLYNNIDNEFMHGVYTSDKNYPFIIMKALSYDRAFDGMKEWEPTMIDDLATYFDLPAEAVDRSLLQDGFSDDLIRNKNVRIARFIPRESDRKGLFDFLKSDGSEFDTDQNGVFETEETLGPESPAPFEESIDPNIFNEQAETFSSQFLERVLFWKPEPVYAQTSGIGGTFLDNTIYDGGASTTVCYKTTRKCLDLVTGQQLPGNSTPSTTVSCYDDIFDPATGELGRTYTPEEVGDQPGYICREILTGAGEIDTLYTTPVCFDAITGNRIQTQNENGQTVVTNPNALCYLPYQCKRIACFQGAQEVPGSYEGRPGVECRVTEQLISPDSEYKKSCTQFTDLMALQNIQDVNLCFAPNGQFIPPNSNAQTLSDFYAGQNYSQSQSTLEILQTSGGATCLSPQNRYQRLCITDNGSIVPGFQESADGSMVPVSPNQPGIALCFEPFNAGSVSAQFGNTNQDIREIAAATALKLELLSGLASGFGLFDNSVSDGLADAAQVFWSIAYADVLDNDVTLTIAEVTRTLEEILDVVDPAAPNSQFAADLRDLIAFIKEALGLSHNVAWVTIGNSLPQGIDIYPGTELPSEIEAVQQALVLLGLMDPVSVTGELDLVTQQALATFQAVNGIGAIDGNGTIPIDQIFISAETLDILQQMVTGAENLYGEDEAASINDFFSESLGLGAYSEQVEALQVLLYAEGYDISSFDGIYDEEVCLAVQQYQFDNGLETADPETCELSPETIESLNNTIRDNSYLGSGYVVGTNGALEGTGTLLGTTGPGTISFEVGEADADTLKEGDIVLMYTFLDEETILITRNETVITEVIRRRAFNDIFNR